MASSDVLKAITLIEANAPVDRQAWLAYRQELRDLTAQAGFPWEVTWPDQPK